MSSEKKYRIMLDTNIVYTEREGIGEIFHRNILDLKKFIKEHKIEKNIQLCLPEIVIGERITHGNVRAKQLVENINNNFNQLSKLDNSVIIPNIQKDFIAILQKKIDQFIKEHNITILNIPLVDQKELIKRALNRIPPFRQHDYGFKDTLIWYSILEDAKQNPDMDYIFISMNDKDFIIEELEPQFKAVSKKSLHIFRQIDEMMSYLDVALNLKLNLKKIFDRIKERVLKQEDKILLEINKNRYYYSYLGSKYIPFLKFESKKIECLSIGEKEKDKFEVTLIVDTNGELSKQDAEKAHICWLPSSINYPLGFSDSIVVDITFEVRATYDEKRDVLNIVNIDPLTYTVRKTKPLHISAEPFSAASQSYISGSYGDYRTYSY